MTTLMNYTNISDELAKVICENYSMDALNYITIQKQWGRFKDKFAIVFGDYKIEDCIFISEEEYDSIRGEDALGEYDYEEMENIINRYL